ncbi:MAG: hypothetical protein AAF802_33410 [Planctomycetota bacterium]
MTIRKLMICTLLMGLAFSLLSWNWGIAFFAASFIPLFWCVSVRKALSQRKFVCASGFAVSTALIYLFSCGPYMAFLATFYGNNAPPPAVDTITSTLYAPHWLVADGPQATDSRFRIHAGEFVNAYNLQWQWVGSDIGVFFRALDLENAFIHFGSLNTRF